VQGQKKIRLRGTDDVVIIRLHMVGKRMEVLSLNNNATSFLALYLSFT
jgi:ribosome maturation protein Sdo1